jgi:hypothetical protein
MMTQRPSRFPFFGPILLASSKLTLSRVFVPDGVVPNPATSTELKVNMSDGSLYCESFRSRLNSDGNHWRKLPCILRAWDVVWSLNFGVKSFKLAARLNTDERAPNTHCKLQNTVQDNVQPIRHRF